MLPDLVFLATGPLNGINSNMMDLKVNVVTHFIRELYMEQIWLLINRRGSLDKMFVLVYFSL